MTGVRQSHRQSRRKHTDTEENTQTQRHRRRRRKGGILQECNEDHSTAAMGEPSQLRLSVSGRGGLLRDTGGRQSYRHRETDTDRETHILRRKGKKKKIYSQECNEDHFTVAIRCPIRTPPVFDSGVVD